MSKVTIEESTLTGIADAIRSKDGTSNPIAVSDFAQRISNITSGSDLPSSLIMGEFVPQTDLAEYEVTHAKGKAPVFAVVYAIDMPIGVPYAQLLVTGVRQGDITKKASGYNTYSGTVGDFSTSNSNISLSSTSVVFTPRGGSYLFKTGVKYRYIIAFAEGETA